MIFVIALKLKTNLNGAMEATDPLTEHLQNPLIHRWQDESDKSIKHLDVCEFIENGGEPYSIIMNFVSSLEPNSSLIIYAPFEPRPLIKQLENMSFTVKLKQEGQDRYSLHITF